MKNLSKILAVVGLLALGYSAVMFVKAHLYQARETKRFTEKARIETNSAGTNSPSATAQQGKPTSPASGEVFGKLTIPRLGLSLIVLEGAGKGELMRGPGHIPGTSLPGDGGNVGIAGHRDTFFRPLRFIRAGDEINLISDAEEYRYHVVSTEVVEPGDVRVLYPTGQETLTLVTCYPFNFLGAAPKRFIIQATSVNSVSTISKGESNDPAQTREPSVPLRTEISAKNVDVDSRQTERWPAK
jgi:sortase A